MASLPEDDGPTMVGAAGERVAVRMPTGHDGQVPPDDTTSAQLGPPAAPPPPAPAAELSPDDLDSDDDEEEQDERTVQQAVPPAVAAAAVAAAAAKARAKALAQTMQSNEPVPLVAPAPVAPPAPMAAAAAPPPDDDDDPIEDSITATAPRLNAANLMDAAQSGHGVPISIPGRVEIRTLEDDDDDPADKTEVRTRPGHGVEIPATLRGAGVPPAPRPAAGRPPDIQPEPEPEPDGGPDDDGVTTQAVAPRLGSVPDIGAPLLAPQKSAAADVAPHTAAVPTQLAGRAPGVRAPSPSTTSTDEPPTRPGVDEGDELLTRPGLGGESEPPTRPGLEGSEPATQSGLIEAPTGKVARKADTAGYANDQDDEDSVTTRGGPTAEPYGEDSVTTQAPNVPIEILHAAIKAAEAAGDGALEDTSADMTKKVKKANRPSSSPADEEAESITTQAPGLVTNMLRVIASGSSPDLANANAAAPIDDDDEGPENRTAVMANAPLKRVIQEAESNARLPAIRPTGGPLSHGPMGAAAPRLEPSSESGLRVARASGSNERASLGQLMAVDARHSGALPAASALGEAGAPGGPADMSMQHIQPSLHDVNLGKGPSYGLLVAIVAVISLAVPVILFVVLRHGSDADPGPAVLPSEPVSEVAKPSAARGKALRGKNGVTIVPSAVVSAPVAPQPSAAPSTAPSGKPGSKGSPFGKR